MTARRLYSVPFRQLPAAFASPSPANRLSVAMTPSFRRKESDTGVGSSSNWGSHVWLQACVGRAPATQRTAAAGWWSSWRSTSSTSAPSSRPTRSACWRAWRALRRAIDPLIVAGGGRIFKALGDGLLVEFTGPVDATRAALAVQAAVAEPALTADTAVRLELRCAIHMGEVTVEGTDLLGDGINVVSRLQEHAPIGGVLVSAAVMDLIAGRLEQPIEELGPLKLRNISRPVHAYAVGPPAAARRRRRQPKAMIDSFQRRRPSIAVLPFVDQSEPRAAPRGSATGWSRTSSPRCRACPS